MRGQAKQAVLRNTINIAAATTAPHFPSAFLYRIIIHFYPAHTRLLLSFRSFRFVLVEPLIMRLPRSPVDAAMLSTFIFPFLASANTLNCEHARADGISWDFKSLEGPKSALHSVENSASWTNTTYTIDLCVPLKRKSDVPDDQKCPGGTQCKLFPSMLLPVALI
jgi:hypothetical protein